jgi:hypothetical protein
MSPTLRKISEDLWNGAQNTFTKHTIFSPKRTKWVKYVDHAAKWFFPLLEDIQTVDELHNAYQDMNSERNDKIYKKFERTIYSSMGSLQYAEDLAYYRKWQELLQKERAQPSFLGC